MKRNDELQCHVISNQLDIFPILFFQKNIYQVNKSFKCVYFRIVSDLICFSGYHDYHVN